MKKDIRVLDVDLGTPEGGAFIDWLLAFRFSDLITCPKDSPMDFRAKTSYTNDEARILSLLRTVEKCKDLMSPIVCSGLRGDGSRFRDKCEFFGGYGKNSDEVWSFKHPQGFVWCGKHGGEKINTQKMTTCKRRELARTVAGHRGLIEQFGSNRLTYASSDECLKCDFKTKDGCGYEIKCGKGVLYFALAYGCNHGDCVGCPEAEK